MKITVKKVFAALLIATACLAVAGCGSSSDSASSGDKKEIKVGVTAGPHAEVMEEVAKEAAKQGLDIKVVEFNDYVQPNKALADGDLDMNSMQHQPYLDNVVQKQGLKLVSIGKTIILPMAIYSHKYKDLKDVADGAKVTIPNDPTNGARACSYSSSRPDYLEERQLRRRFGNGYYGQPEKSPVRRTRCRSDSPFA